MFYMLQAVGTWCWCAATSHWLYEDAAAAVDGGGVRAVASAGALAI